MYQIVRLLISTGAAVTAVLAGLAGTAGAATPVPSTCTSTGDGAPTITVSKTADLAAAGETVAVSGTGFDECKGIYVAFCVVPPAGEAPSPCGGGIDLSGTNPSSSWISSNPPAYGVGLAVPYGPDGTFSANVNVSAMLSDTIDCRLVQCAVVTRNDHTRSTDRSQDVIVPVFFAADPVPETMPPTPPPTLPPTPPTPAPTPAPTAATLPPAPVTVASTTPVVVISPPPATSTSTTAPTRTSSASSTTSPPTSTTSSSTTSSVPSSPTTTTSVAAPGADDGDGSSAGWMMGGGLGVVAIGGAGGYAFVRRRGHP